MCAVKDLEIVILVATASATVITAHLATVYGLLWRQPRWRAIVALVAIPMAPYWAFREKMYLRATLFVLGVIAYAAGRYWAAQGLLAVYLASSRSASLMSSGSVTASSLSPSCSVARSASG